MKIINIGVLAHVDAGKTTLTESLLYNSGAITELGSVDKGTTRTDNTLLERQRGITIQTGITSFQWENTKVNIIDTPGHMDFLAEVYRSLSVLDGAILLISAKDGVQAQTRILFHALRKMGIPTIFFINKIDQNGIDLSTVYQDIKEKLSAEIVIKQKVELYPNMCVTNFTESEQWDTVIEGNDDLLEKYMSGKSLEALELEQEESIRFQNCSLFPLYHGSAKSNIGIDNLIEVVKKYNKYNEDKLPHITPHSLRHTFCTNYANAGMNPKALQYIMGHANIAMTLNYYAHATFDSAMAEMKRLNKEKQQERLVA